MLLSSRLDARQLAGLGWHSLAFVAIIIVVGRPLSVWLSTIGSKLEWRERVLIAFMAPRGIVAAAVASVFALRLRQAQVPGAERLVPNVFAVIVLTVLVYGIGAPLLARRLGLGTRGKGGFVIAGANPVAAAIALALKREKQDVLVVDTNHSRTTEVRLAGVPTLTMSILSNAVLERLEGSGIGRLLALTPNEEVNALAAMHLGRSFGRSSVFQLATEQKEKRLEHRKVSRDLAGRTLFGPTMTFEKLSQRLAAGAVFKRTTFSNEFPYDQFMASHEGEEIMPLFHINESGEFSVVAIDEAVTPKIGHALVYLSGVKGVAGESITAAEAVTV